MHCNVFSWEVSRTWKSLGGKIKGGGGIKEGAHEGDIWRSRSSDIWEGMTTDQIKDTKYNIKWFRRSRRHGVWWNGQTSEWLDRHRPETQLFKKPHRADMNDVDIFYNKGSRHPRSRSSLLNTGSVLPGTSSLHQYNSSYNYITNDQGP